MSDESCTLGMGCDEAGQCYAAVMGQPEKCGRPGSSGTREAVEPVALIQPEVLMALAKDKTATGTVSSPLLRQPFGSPVPLYAAPPSDPVGQGAVTSAMVNAAWNAGKHRRMTGSTSDFRAVLEAALALSPATEAGSDDVERLRSKVAELQKERASALRSVMRWRSQAETAKAHETALRDQLRKMREALAFYADPENYRPRDPYPSHIEKDNRGDRARTAMVSDTFFRATLAETQEAGL